MMRRVIKLIVSLGVALADSVQRQVLMLLGREPAAICVVLYYHAVRAEDRSAFARQMDDLLRIGIPVPSDRIGPLDAGRRYIVVTFDDGFVSVRENALPELRSRRIPFTIFVPTGWLGSWPGWLRPGHSDASETVMSAELLQALAEDGAVTIGSHSIQHPDFRTLDDDRARVELAQSKSDLEGIVRKDVTLFSFPHGACTSRSCELAREAGYTRVFTIEPRRASDAADPFVIGRVQVGPRDWPIEFRLKATGAYRWLAGASAWKRRLRDFVFQERTPWPLYKYGR